MGRKAVLNDEQVWMIRNQAFPKTLKEWAEYFDVSVPVIIDAKKKRGPYDFEFKQEYHNAMVAQYINGRELGC